MLRWVKESKPKAVGYLLGWACQVVPKLFARLGTRISDGKAEVPQRGLHWASPSSFTPVYHRLQKRLKREPHTQPVTWEGEDWSQIRWGGCEDSLTLPQKESLNGAVHTRWKECCGYYRNINSHKERKKKSTLKTNDLSLGESRKQRVQADFPQVFIYSYRKKLLRMNSIKQEKLGNEIHRVR